MNYLVGDIQGCCDALDRLLSEIDFSPSRDRLYVLGDLVNRGPASLGTLQRLRGLGEAATCLLGNHDIHLLAVACGVRSPHRSDTVDDILQGRERDAWIDWLRHRPMAVHAHGWLMVHAGVAPQWDLPLTLQLAAELQDGLRCDDLTGFLHNLFGNEPSLWTDALVAPERQRLAVNALTRIRFVQADGRLEFKSKDADDAPPGCLPWFDHPERRTQGVPIAFGHWSTLGLVDRADLLALDTGCVWGGQLTAARVDGASREIIQVRCKQAKKPGK